MTPNPPPSSTDANHGQAIQPCPQAQNNPKTWIAIELIGEDDKPIPGIAYRILLTDGTTRDGSLDGEGSARIDGIDPGTCMVTFPGLDQDAWEGI
ncbi:MAG: hypothetical protein ABSG03_39525 [Bryobacteraceae bacterium]|jgi:hypothetical protein